VVLMFEVYHNRFTPKGRFNQPDPYSHLAHAFVLKDAESIERMDEVYAWCVEHFGAPRKDGGWEVYLDVVYLGDPTEVVEFKLRWF
jgi:hypothetical protein